MIRSLAILGLVAALSAATARAQLSQSTNFRLDDFAFAGGGGGAASAGFAAQLAFEPLAGDEIASANFRATMGFLAAWDPQPGSGPAVFGVAANAGPTAGGTPVVVSGMNFSKLGSAPTVQLSIGGVPATNVAVASNTKITATAPPGAAGAKAVTVTSALGSDSLPNGFQYLAGLAPYGTGTPGCAGTHTLSATFAPKLDAPMQLTCDHAPPNALGLGLLSAAQDVTGHDPLALGVLFHVDLFAPGLIGIDLTSDAAGLGSWVGSNPANPALAGVTVYMDALWYWAGSCPLGLFSLSSSRGLAITYEL